MDRKLALIRRRIWTLAFQLKIIRMRRSARWVLDQFQFGSGTAERLAAGLVLAAVFFLGLLGVGALAGWPLPTALLLGGVALGSALITSAVLVLGPSDEELVCTHANATEDLAEARAIAVNLREQIAERKAEEAARAAEQEAEETALAAEQEAEEAARVAAWEEKQRRTCGYCGGRIKPWASKCPHCREYLDDDLARERRSARDPKANTGVAAVLSFLIPGLGQIYKGQVLSGLVWFFVIQSLYVASVLTLMCCIGFVGIPVVIMLHLICIFDAASGG